jgi:hypothetical protein
VVRHPKPALAWRIMARRVGLSLAIAALLFVVVTIATARWGNRSLWPPAPGAPTTEVFIVSHGYHAGIIVPRAALADEASRRGLSALGYLATRFADFDRLEIGLYGMSLFFRANGAFHLFNVCNHWIANLLDAAGVPTAPVLATLPFGLLLDLEWRSGLARLPPPPAPKP